MECSIFKSIIKLLWIRLSFIWRYYYWHSVYALISPTSKQQQRAHHLHTQHYSLVYILWYRSIDHFFDGQCCTPNKRGYHLLLIYSAPSFPEHSWSGSRCQTHGGCIVNGPILLSPNHQDEPSLSLEFPHKNTVEIYSVDQNINQLYRRRSS